MPILSGKDWAWNFFDLLVILVSLADAIIELWLLTSVQVRVFRLFLIFRYLRGIRVVRLFRYISALQVLTLAIIATLGSCLERLFSRAIELKGWPGPSPSWSSSSIALGSSLRQLAGKASPKSS